MKIYQVRAQRWKRGWELHIDGVGVTQARRLNEAEAMARDYIAMDLDLADDSFDVEITEIKVDAETDSLANNARRAVQEAQSAQVEASKRITETVNRLSKDGLTGREIARYLNVSPQRISQITKKTTDKGLVDKTAGKARTTRKREKVRP